MADTSLMDPQITLQAVIVLLGAAHGLFLCLAIINVDGPGKFARLLLALLTLTFTVDLAIEFLLQTRYLVLFPKVFLLTLSTSFLSGPLTYLYVKSLTTGASPKRNAVAAHFLPFLLSFACLLPFYLTTDQVLLGLLYNNEDAIEQLGLWAILGVLVELTPIVQIGFYVAFSLLALRQYRHSIRQHFSTLEGIRLSWLRNLLFGLALLYLLYAIASMVSSDAAYSKTLDSTLYYSIVILIYVMGYKGMRQASVFTGAQARTGTNASGQQGQSQSALPAKYERSSLDESASLALFEELIEHMRSAKPYLDSQLTLGVLADQLQLSNNNLSQVINQQGGSNFFDFVNRYRVEAAKQSLSRSDGKVNVLQVAMDAGFNSKSAFYTAFKSETGLTPTQYRKAQARQLRP